MIFSRTMASCWIRVCTRTRQWVNPGCQRFDPRVAAWAGWEGLRPSYHAVIRHEARFVDGRERVFRRDQMGGHEEFQGSGLCEESHLAHVVHDGIQHFSFERSEHDGLVLDFEHGLSRVVFDHESFSYVWFSQHADDVSVSSAAGSFHLFAFPPTFHRASVGQRTSTWFCFVVSTSQRAVGVVFAPLR